MQIFRARPLCCFFWVLSCVIVAYAVFSPTVRFLTFMLIIVSCLAVLLGVVAALVRWHRPRLWYCFFLLTALLVGLLGSLCHAYTVIRPANDFAAASGGDAIEIQGTVLSQEIESSYIAAYGMRVQLSNGNQAHLYLTATGEYDLKIGDIVRVKANVLPIVEAREESWRIRSLQADGYVLAAYVEENEELTVIGRSDIARHNRFAEIQRSLAYRLSGAVGREQGALVSALLLGTRTALSDATTLDFRRSGASHLLALSGLHLSIVVLMIGWILRILRCPYYLRLLLLSASAGMFLLLTGCSISTVRATAMLFCLYLSKLRGAPHDPLTSLSVFLGACLLARPTWSFDASLWLSVLATFAIIEIVPALICEKEVSQDRRGGAVFRRIYRLVVIPILSSYVVMLVLLVPMALIFGEVSLLTPLSNLLLTPLCAAILAVGLLTLPVLCLTDRMPWLEPVLERMVDVLRWLASAMLHIAERLSDVEGALISLRYRFVLYLLGALVVAFIAFLMLRWKKPTRFWLVAVGWSAVFAVCLILNQATNTGAWEARYALGGNSEVLLLNDGNDTIVCDIGDGSYATYRQLMENGLPTNTTEIDALVLTHYHKRHISTVYKLAGQYRIRSIWLPLTMPYTTQEKAIQDEGILRSIVAIAQSGRIEIHYYRPDEATMVTDTLTLERLHYDMLKRSTHPTLAMCWSYRERNAQLDNRLVYMGASAWESSGAEEIFYDLAASDVLILAGHGPVIKSQYSIPLWVDEPALVVFKSGDVAAALTPSSETTSALRQAELILAEKPYISFVLP